jgi:hypothetical protein
MTKISSKKPMLKKFSIIIIIIFLLFCFFGGLFLYYPKDEMAKLIPREVIFYGQWGKQDIKILKEQNIKILGYWDIGKIFQKIPCQKLLDVGFIEAKKTGIAVLLNEKGFSCLNTYFIQDKGISTKVLDEFEKKRIKYVILKNYLILSQEESIIEKVKILKDNPQLSLAEILPRSQLKFFAITNWLTRLRSLSQVIGEGSARNDSGVKAYLNLSFSKNYLIDKKDLTSQVAFSLIEEVKNTEWLIFQLKAKDNKLVFNLSNDVRIDIPEENFTSENFSKNFFVATNIDWQKKIEKWGELIPDLEEKIKEWEKLYNFNFQKDIFPLLKKPNFFLVDLSESNADPQHKSDIDFFRNIKWVFLTQKSANNESLKKINEIAKQILAYKLPVEKEKILPDGSKVKELIADFSKHGFKQIETDQVNFYLLQKPEVNFEFVYGIMEDVGDVLKYISNNSNVIAFSNSLEFLEKTIQNLKLTPEEEILYFNLGDEKMIIRDYSGKGKVDIMGQIY